MRIRLGISRVDVQPTNVRWDILVFVTLSTRPPSRFGTITGGGLNIGAGQVVSR